MICPTYLSTSSYFPGFASTKVYALSNLCNILEACSGFQECKMELLSSEASGVGKSYEDESSNANLTEERTDNLEEDVISDQVPTFAIHEKSPMETISHRILDSHESSISNSAEDKTSNLNQQGEVLINGEVEAAESTKRNVVARKVEKKGSSVSIEHGKFNFGQKSQDSSPRKVILTVQFISCVVQLNICLFVESDFLDNSGFLEH